MKKPELLAPAGSPDGVRAAVQSGADAVYMGFGTFNARRGAQNFTKEQMAQALAYCRARGVKTNVTFNIMLTDRERDAALQDARFLYEQGADALIVQDLGMAALLRQYAPEIALHASTQMTIHTLDGARQAKALGFSRVVLSRECTREQIRRITAQADIETEVFVHGALCMCYSGQCYLSSVIGRRSGNRGLCAQPCRLPYRYTGKNSKPQYPLSLRDLCLAAYLKELTQLGVASLKIEGRMKRPEYTAIVTQVYADLLHEQRAPTAAEQEILQKVFSRDGFTDGYYTAHKGAQMFGTKTEVPLQQVKVLYDAAAKRCQKESPRVAVDFIVVAKAKQALQLTAQTQDGEKVTEYGVTPEYAQNRAMDTQALHKALQKTGGTPFYVRDCQITLEDNLAFSLSAVNALRRDALDKLLSLRSMPPVKQWHEPAIPQQAQKNKSFAGYTIEVRSFAQLTPDLLQLQPAALYVPLTELCQHTDKLEKLAQRLPLCAVLPRIANDNEQQEINAMLKQVKQHGVTAALIGNIGQLAQVKACGLQCYGDFGLNIANSAALAAVQAQGICRQTVSFELRLAQIRDLSKPIETEMLIYGYLPLMLMENCVIQRKNGQCSCKKERCSLTDRRGMEFTVLPEYGCRNTLLNSQPLLLEKEYQALGVTFARLRFTTEAPDECAQIARHMMQDTDTALCQNATRGLYYRGVE